MKKAAISPALLALALALLSSSIAQAQGTIYVWNLGQPSAGSLSVGSNSWVAAAFRPGINAGGYVLDSVQLALADASGSPTGFTVMLYATIPNSTAPFSYLATLNGSLDPVAAGVYSFTPASTLTLLSYVSYDIVLTAETPIAVGAYEWSFATTNFYNPSGGWATAGSALTSGNGSFWTVSAGNYAQFAITATPAPEPSTLGLLALGGGFVLWRRLKVKPSDTA
jgi:PEP-CTERM motif